MKNNDVTEVVFVLDKSGSMNCIKKDTIGGFNSMLETQKNQEGKANITVCAFNENINWLHDHIDIKDAKELTDQDYIPCGCTALLDAIGASVAKIENITKQTETKKVVFIIITDGLENASKEYSNNMIKKIIAEKEEKGWQFMFLGANIDAFATAGDIGIKKSNTANWVQDEAGSALSFKCVAKAVAGFRKSGALDECCLEEVNEDYRKRG